MRIGQFVSGIASFALMVGMGQALLAQTSTSGVSGSVGVGIGVGVRGPVGTAGAPYSATRKTTRVQKLANGTTITHESSVKMARDSSGRTYQESRRESSMGLEGGSNNVVSVNVYDPVNRLTIFWNSNTKEAIVTHFPEPREIKRTEVQPVQAMVDPTPMPRLEPIRPQIEDLGMRTINGVEAKGTRTTRVIPTGREGNDQPITVTLERWAAVDLGLVVMSVQDDPRTGTSTIELTDLEKGEPDPALFQVPEGYTVKDRTPAEQN
jgi:hypothetical protein